MKGGEQGNADTAGVFQGAQSDVAEWLLGRVYRQTKDCPVSGCGLQAARVGLVIRKARRWDYEYKLTRR